MTELRNKERNITKSDLCAVIRETEVIDGSFEYLGDDTSFAFNGIRRCEEEEEGQRRSERVKRKTNDWAFYGTNKMGL